LYLNSDEEENVTESASIDRAVFDGQLDAIGDDRDFMIELLQTYFDDSPNLLATMRDALATARPDEFRRAAHSLKSNSASFGAVRLSRLCKELEDMGKSGTLDGAGERLAVAEAEYVQVRAELERIASSE
jgi:HPt (histidine-containing phosphotransfer) domain-containing protein